MLCGLTLLSMALVEGGWSRSVASIIIVLIAATKSRLVICTTWRPIAPQKTGASCIERGILR
jgi:hypothetical protein